MHADPNAPSSEPEIKGKLNTSDDIYGILSRQHEEAKKMFDKLFESSANNPEEVRELRETGRRLAVELISHNEAESQTLYGRLAKFENLRNDVERHRREHEEANAQLTALLNAGAEDVEWLERIGEIRKGVEAHIADEEEKLFPRAKKLLDSHETRTLAGEFTYLQDLRKNLMQPL